MSRKNKPNVGSKTKNQNTNMTNKEYKRLHCGGLRWGFSLSLHFRAFLPVSSSAAVGVGAGRFLCDTDEFSSNKATKK